MRSANAEYIRNDGLPAITYIFRIEYGECRTSSSRRSRMRDVFLIQKKNRKNVHRAAGEAGCEIALRRMGI